MNLLLSTGHRELTGRMEQLARHWQDSHMAAPRNTRLRVHFFQKTLSALSCMQAEVRQGFKDTVIPVFSSANGNGPK